MNVFVRLLPNITCNCIMFLHYIIFLWIKMFSHTNGSPSAILESKVPSAVSAYFYNKSSNYFTFFRKSKKLNLITLCLILQLFLSNLHKNNFFLKMQYISDVVISNPYKTIMTFLLEVLTQK